MKNNGKDIYDLDSSQFSKGSEFPKIYVDEIEKLARDDNAIILISSHIEVRKELQNRNIKYILVYPNPNLRSEYIDRYIKRNDSKAFIKLMDNNWDGFMKTMEDDKYGDKIILKTNEYLSNVI